MEINLDTVNYVSLCLMLVALGFCLFFFMNFGMELAIILNNFLKVKFGSHKWYCAVMERECHRYQHCPHYKFMQIYGKELTVGYEKEFDFVDDDSHGSDEQPDSSC